MENRIAKSVKLWAVRLPVRFYMVVRPD